MDLFAVILCGGCGSRLWPLSTNTKPKQFIAIHNHMTLLENTIKRIPNNFKKIFITNIKYKEYIQEYTTSNDIILYEPAKKNTGPAILAALKLINMLNKNSRVIIIPSDHIFDESLFNKLIISGLLMTEENKIITWGIKPSYPEVDYGYIKNNGNSIEFIEKPNKDLAIKLCNSGSYLWNSGVFMFKTNTLNTIVNEMCAHDMKYINFINNEDMSSTEYYLDETFKQSIDISFDKLVMERINNGSVIEFDGLWTDIGDWKRLYDTYSKDKDDNVVIGDKIKTFNTRKSLILTKNSNIVCIDVSDLAIVEYEGNIFVSRVESCSKIKTLL